MGVKIRFYKLILLHFLIFYFIVSISITLSFSEPLPVVVELFTSNQNCSTCIYATDALRQLYEEFDEQPVIPLTYHYKDTLAFSNGTKRSSNYYAVNQTPTIYFNGNSKIVGAKKGIISTYRSNITSRLGVQSNWIMRGDIQINGENLSSTVRVLSDATPEVTLDLHFLLIDSSSIQEIHRVLYFETVTSVSNSEAVAFVTIDDPWVMTNSAWKALWVLQAQGSKEIVQAKIVSAESDYFLDLDGNGRIDFLDIFVFSHFWHSSHPLIDFNFDQKVNGLDLLRLMERGSKK